MTNLEAQATAPLEGLPLAATADLQDRLLVASNDLDRLQRLLDHATQALLGHFRGASAHMVAALRDIERMQGADAAAVQEAYLPLGQAVTALPFQDMATQLITHTTSRLRNRADRLAADAFAGDDDGEAVIEAAPLRPNPVTQDEMDAGSIELF